MTIIIAEDTDLFTLNVEALGHGCNAIGQMGSGIAVPFRAKWPDMYTAYRAYCLANDKSAVGMFPWQSPDGLWIYDLFTQKIPGPNASLARCLLAFDDMFEHANKHNVKTIGLPAVGCGIGGLKWPDVQECLELSLERNHYKGQVTVAFKKMG